MRQTKVLIIGKTVSTGGTSRYVTNLVQTLRKANTLDFDFINLKRYYDLPGKYMKRLNLIRTFPKELDYDAYDLIHFLQTDYALYGVLRHLKNRKTKPKVLKTSHGLAEREEGMLKSFVEQYIFRPLLLYQERYVQRHVDAILYVSDYQREYFIKQYHLNRQKTHVVYLASSFENYPGGIDTLLEGKENLILFVGRIETRKNVQKLFDVATLLPEMTFKVIGHVDDPSYYAELRRSKPRNVELLTDIPDAELITTYRQAKFFVSFSKWENCPVTYLEAISQGTPVIAYSMPLQKMVDNGGGYQVQTPAECVTTIRALERDYPAVVQKTMNTARLFSWEKTASETVQVYHELLHPR